MANTVVQLLSIWSSPHYSYYLLLAAVPTATLMAICFVSVELLINGSRYYRTLIGNLK